MTDKKPLIAIDIDDVIADTNEVMREWTNRTSGASLTKEDFLIPGDYWGYYERVWAHHELDHLQFDDFENEFIEDQTHVPLLAGAAFAIKELEKKYRIVLLTSRNPVIEAATRRWVDEHIGPHVEIVFARNGRMKEGITKGEICKQMGATLLIDDNEEHIQSALDQGLDTILFGDYGWQHDAPKGAILCKDWPAVLEYLSGRQ